MAHSDESDPQALRAKIAQFAEDHLATVSELRNLADAVLEQAVATLDGASKIKRISADPELEELSLELEGLAAELEKTETDLRARADDAFEAIAPMAQEGTLIARDLELIDRIMALIQSTGPHSAEPYEHPAIAPVHRARNVVTAELRRIRELRDEKASE